LNDTEEALELIAQQSGEKIVESQQKAIQDQLKFRKIVLGQKSKDPKIFNISQKGKFHSIDDLKNNIMTLISERVANTVTEPASLKPRQPLLVGKYLYVDHTFIYAADIFKW